MALFLSYEVKSSVFFCVTVLNFNWFRVLLRLFLFLEDLDLIIFVAREETTAVSEGCDVLKLFKDMMLEQFLKSTFDFEF